MVFRWMVVLGIGLVEISAPASQLAVDDPLPTISAKDQHGAEFVFTNGTKYLLVATEMACAKAANHKLADQGGGFLEKSQAVYLMDIHTMPSIARMFAFPKMRKYPQRIVLVDSAATLADFPTQPGRVTVMALTSAGRIQKISYWNPDNEPVTDYLR